jgi:hypothetical protein
VDSILAHSPEAGAHIALDTFSRILCCLAAFGALLLSSRRRSQDDGTMEQG